MTNDERDELGKALATARQLDRNHMSGDPTPARIAFCALVRAVEILAGQFEQVGFAVVKAVEGVHLIEREVSGKPMAEPQAFGEALVERLVRISWDAQMEDDWIRVNTPPWDDYPEVFKKAGRVGIRAILSELARAQCELPTSEPIERVLRAYDNTGQTDNFARAMHLAGWLREQLAPILAAKDAENARLSARLIECRRLLSTRVEAVRLDKANSRIAALEKDAKEKQASAHAYIVSLEKRLAEQTAPLVVDGKTPGEFFRDVQDAYYHKTIGDTEDREVFARVYQESEDVAVKAVLDMFGKQKTREALERVRDKVRSIPWGSKGYEIDYAAIRVDVVGFIEAELAKLGEAKPCHCQWEAGDSPCPLHGDDHDDKPTSDHTPPKKYDRAWLSEQTDDALFDLYMQQIGFFDMNGSMVEREAMIETLASIEEMQDRTGQKKPTKPAVEVRFENVQISGDVDAAQLEKLGRDKLKIDHVHELGSCSFCDKKESK
jgi:hypothetical protein